MQINREALRSSSRLRKRKVFRLFSYACLALAAAFAGTSFLSHIDKLYIKTIYISGNKQVSDGQIFDLASGILQGRYYGLYPKSNILIYPKDFIAETLRHNLYWIDIVEISGTLGALSINVTERLPQYLRCDDLSKNLPDRICFYVDKDGFVFSPSPAFSNHIYLEFYGGDKRGGYIGRAVLSPSVFRSVLEIKDFAEKNIADNYRLLGRAYGIYIYGNGDYDLLFTGGKKEWKIIFNLSDRADTSEIAAIKKKLSAIMASGFFLTELNNPQKSLEYIDLRFGKKVFYKFKENPI